MATGFGTGCGNPTCESCYGRYPQQSSYGFQGGDYVEAIGSYMKPYRVTCNGWRGTVIRVRNSKIWVRGQGSSGASEEFEVEPQYFRIISRSIRPGNDESYYQTKMMTYDEVRKQYPEAVMSTGDGELIKKGKSMQKLNVMQKLLLSKEDQVLAKACYINGDLQLTEKGRQSLMAILFTANKAELVKLAQSELDEEKEESK